jgi:pentatricopeptide repeat domain-containing protein 1
MPAQGCKPDSITYSALITAYQRAGQWKRALRAFEDMQMEGLHPDSVVFNTLLEVLWQSGVLLAQMRAAQLWSAANRSGQFR